MPSVIGVAADSSQERQVNTVAVLSALNHDASVRLAELARRTGLSRATVDSILTELVDLGWVEQQEPSGGPGPRPAGRPARTYRLDRDAGYVIGLDVGVDTLTAMVADVTGCVRHRAHRRIPATSPGPDRLVAVQSLITDAAAVLGVHPAETLALALAVPGVVDPSGRVALSSVIPDWTGVHLQRHFERWARVPIGIGNDANMATLAEHWCGAGRLVEDMIYVLAGRRTSAGFILGGKLHTGRHGAAGEIGTVPDLYSDAEEVLTGQAGDPAARGLVDEYHRKLARTVEFLVKAFDPDLVVVGGGVSRAGQSLVDGIDAHLDRGAFSSVPLVLSTLGPDAVVVGAVHSALQLAIRHRPLIAAIVHPPLTLGAGEP